MKIEEISIGAVPPTVEEVDVGDVPDVSTGDYFHRGMQNVVNSFLGFLEGQGKVGREQAKKRDVGEPESVKKFTPYSTEELSVFEEISKSAYEKGVLKPAQLPRRKGVRGYIDSVAETTPQIIAQVGATLLGGPGGGGIFMGSQIQGSKYKRLVEKGTDPMVAFKASVLDASLQAPLEQIGIGKALKFWKPAASGATVFKAMLEGGATEFITEFIQQYPDAATEIWADAQREGKTNQEAVDVFLERFAEITKEGLEAGSVGAFFGVALGGVGAAVNRPAVEQTSEPTVEEVDIEETAKQERLGQIVDETTGLLDELEKYKGEDNERVTEINDRLAELIEESDGIEAFLAKEVDEVAGESVPPGGLSIRETTFTPDITRESISVSDPEIEARLRAARGLRGEPVTSKAREFIRKTWHRTTRVFEDLPHTPEYAQLRQLLVKIPKNRAIAMDRTLRMLDGVIGKLNEDQFLLFERKVLFDDLMNEASQEHDLPFGFTPEVLADEHSKVSTMVESDPRVRDAFAKRTAFMEGARTEYTNAMNAIGVKTDFDNPVYFRHQVLIHANEKSRVKGTGEVKSPTKRSFRKGRKGSTYDINTNYVQAESEVVAQMLHDIELAKIIRYAMARFDVSAQVKADQKANGVQSRFIDKDFVPEGYATWQPDKGSLFYMADSIPSRIADILMGGKMEIYGLTSDEIHKVMASAGRKLELVLPEDIVKTLKDPFPKGGENMLSRADRRAIKAWKVWSLSQPRRLFKYNARNLSGDAEAIFLGNPRAFLKAPRAFMDLWRVFVEDGAMPPKLRMWFTMGGMESTLQFQEIGDLHKLKMFERAYGKQQKTVGEKVATPFREYWRRARLATDFREALLRYAAFLDYMERLESGEPLGNYGASIMEEVDAMEGNVEKAFKLSNDLLGAYDEVTVFGRALREHLIPFWSFQEINMRRYWRFFKNAVNDGKTAESVGRAVAAKGLNPMTYVRIGKFLVMVMALDTATNVYNNLFWSDEEDDLPESVRMKTHIILGRDKNGKVMYFSRLGLLQDVLDWFNLEDYRLTIRELLNGKTTVKEVIKEMAKGPVDKIFQGSRPFLKLIGELAFRRASFPSVFEPRAIRDRGYHLAKSFGLENEYVALMRLPSEGYEETMRNFFVYSVDPTQSKYSNTLDKVNRFRKKINKGQGDGFFVSPKGNALYNYKLAKKLGDEDGAKRFLNEYVRYTTSEGIREKKLSLQDIDRLLKQSIKRAEPLYGLNDTERAVFISQLDEREKKDLAAAYHFWLEVLDGKTVIGR